MIVVGWRTENAAVIRKLKEKSNLKSGPLFWVHTLTRWCTVKITQLISGNWWMK
jgi:hypothetical protein